MARIVVVERDERVLSAVAKILESRGHEVAGVADVGAAIKAIGAQPPSLLITDFTTLGAKRSESVARLRAAAPMVPTIFVADSRVELLEASSSAASEGSAMVLGLKKPLRRQALLDTIARALAIHATAGAPKPRETSTHSEAKAQTGAQHSILVVDADEVFRRTMSRALEKASLTVYSAADGNEGMDLFQRHKPDVSIVEVVLPGKDGITMIGEMRMLAPDAKIVAMSGADPRAPEANLSIAWMYGASRSLRKPFRMGDLLATVSELITESGTQSSRAHPSPRRA